MKTAFQPHQATLCRIMTASRGVTSRWRRCVEIKRVVISICTDAASTARVHPAALSTAHPLVPPPVLVPPAAHLTSLCAGCLAAWAVSLGLDSGFWTPLRVLQPAGARKGCLFDVDVMERVVCGSLVHSQNAAADSADRQPRGPDRAPGAGSPAGWRSRGNYRALRQRTRPLSAPARGSMGGGAADESAEAMPTGGRTTRDSVSRAVEIRALCENFSNGEDAAAARLAAVGGVRRRAQATAVSPLASGGADRVFGSRRSLEAPSVMDQV